MAQYRLLNPSGAQDPHAFRRVLLVGGVSIVRPPLVVEIVQQAREAPRLDIFTEACGVRQHRGFHCQHVLPEGITGRVFVHQFEGFGPEHRRVQIAE